MSVTDKKQNEVDRRLKYEAGLSKLLQDLGDIDLSGDIYDEAAYMHATGGFCDIFIAKSRAHHNAAVAVKRLRVHIMRSENVAKELLRELRIWATLEHPNILPLLGYCMHGAYPALVSRWMFNGSVLKYMEKNKKVEIMDMMKGIAAGLLYLHNRDIIHSDLKSDNILVSDVGDPLLADFGISRIMSSTSSFTSSTNIKGSARWMAIELWVSTLSAGEEKGGHTKESDMWAFGMVIYELLTGRAPFYQLKNDLQVSFAIAKGELPTRPEGLGDTLGDRSFLWSICGKCWETSISDRPEMFLIYNQLVLRRLSNSASMPSHFADLLLDPYFGFSGISTQQDVQNSPCPDDESVYDVLDATAPLASPFDIQDLSRPSGGSATAHASPAAHYHDWVSDILSPLSDFIDHSSNPRDIYTDLKKIGEGDYGPVYSARIKAAQNTQGDSNEDLPKASYVATIRVPLRPDSNTTRNLIGLKNELTIARHIQSHVNILTVDALHVDLSDKCLWIETKLMERSLADILQASREGFVLEEKLIRQFAKEIVKGLLYLQTLNIAHRNIRPDNVWIQSMGVLKLSDFSHAVHLSTAISSTVELLSSSGPVFPRKSQRLGLGRLRGGHKADVWSLGRIVYEMAEASTHYIQRGVEGTRKKPDLIDGLITHPERFSTSFHEFLHLCLLPSSKRPNAKQLITNQFIQGAACTYSLVRKALADCRDIEDGSFKYILPDVIFPEEVGL